MFEVTKERKNGDDEQNILCHEKYKQYEKELKKVKNRAIWNKMAKDWLENTLYSENKKLEKKKKKTHYTPSRQLEDESEDINLNEHRLKNDVKCERI